MEPTPELFQAMREMATHCGGCGRNFPLGQLQFCGGCRLVPYCSTDCQREHWSIHKPDCPAFRKFYAENRAAVQSTRVLAATDQVKNFDVILASLTDRCCASRGCIQVFLNDGKDSFFRSGEILGFCFSDNELERRGTGVQFAVTYQGKVHIALAARPARNNGHPIFELPEKAISDLVAKNCSLVVDRTGKMAIAYGCGHRFPEEKWASFSHQH